MANYRGCLAKFVDSSRISDYIHNVPVVDSEAVYHITIIPAVEFKTIDNFDPKDGELDDKFDILGLGRTQEYWYLVCNYPCGDLIRKKYGLRMYDFHITIGPNINDVSKIIRTILRPEIPKLLPVISNKTSVLAKYIYLVQQIVDIFPEPTFVFELAKSLANCGRLDEALNYGYQLISTGALTEGYLILLRIKLHRKEDVAVLINEITTSMSSLEINDNLPRLLELVN